MSTTWRWHRHHHRQWIRRAGYADTLQFGAGITPASVTLVRTGNDLTFRISETDQITVKNWYVDVDYNAIENVTFADGTVWTHASMQSVVPQQIHLGTASTETINGWFGIDLIDGAGGNDTINGNEGTTCSLVTTATTSSMGMPEPICCRAAPATIS